MEFEHLVKLIEAVSESPLTGFKYEENGIKLNIQKEKAQTVAAVTEPVVCCETAEQHVAVKEEKEGRLIKSPLVGTFYVAASEDSEPFVSVGTQVTKGQTIAIVEAMKLMNEIESDFDGTVTEVLAANGEAVEYGQPLFRIA